MPLKYNNTITIWQTQLNLIPINSIQVKQIELNSNKVN